jgi:hypothetical protein
MTHAQQLEISHVPGCHRHSFQAGHRCDLRIADRRRSTLNKGVGHQLTIEQGGLDVESEYATCKILHDQRLEPTFEVDPPSALWHAFDARRQLTDHGRRR